MHAVHPPEVSRERRPDPAISVVIVNWNSREDLGACLDALAAQTDRNFEVILVDNGSTDGSLELVAGTYPWVTLVAAGENLGFAEGCNRGIDAATGDWIATLNNDACPRPDWIAELRRAASEAGERVGMLQAKMLFKDRPERTNSTGLLLFANGNAKDRDFDALDSSRDADEVFCPTAGAAMYRRTMLEQIRLPHGIFDRTFFMYFEDVDLGWRCRLAGWSALYVPSAVVLHAFQGSSKRMTSDFVRWHCRKNRVSALARNASLGFIVRSLPRTLADGVWVLRARGVPGFREYVGNIASSIRTRKRVNELARVSRADLEKRWISSA